MAKSGKYRSKSKTSKKHPAPASAASTKEAPDRLERPAVDTPADPLLRRIFWGLAVAGLLIMAGLSFGSGINADDKFQNDYSLKLVDYYTSFGKDTAALNVPDGNMHLYGGFFEIITGLANKALGFEPNDLGYHNVRHLFTAILGWVAILCAALLARLIAGWRAGVITLVIMLVSPRFLGDSLMNPKDIPFAAGYIMAVYNMAAVLSRMPSPGRWNIAGLVAGLAISLAMRAGGLLNFAYLFMFAGLFLVLKKGWGSLFDLQTIRRYAVVVVGAAVAGYIGALLFWPFALQKPLTNPYFALTKFSDFEIAIRVLYDGENVKSNQTPWHYLVRWIELTIPLAAVLGFLGSLALLPRLLKRYQPLWIGLVYFAAIFPVVYVIYKKSNVYDGWRQLTFAYPTLAVAAALFWNELLNLFSGKKVVQYATYGLLALLLSDAAIFIAANPKIPYVYFNPLAGGVKGAYGKYETDYWGVSIRQGIEWMEQQGILKPDMTEKVVIATNMFYPADKLLAKYGDMVKVKYLKWERRCDDVWDYGLFPTRFIDGNTLEKGYWPPDNAAHVIEAGGTPILAILKDSDRNCAFGIAAMKLQDWTGAIDYLRKEVAAVPDNELAWANLAQAYLNSSQLDEAKAAAEKALEISPDDLQANNLLGLYWINKGDVAQAKAQFEQALRREPANPAAYYYLATIAQRQGDNQTALNNLRQAIEIAPTFRPAYEFSALIYESMGNTAAAQQYRAILQQLR
ncbi:MAG: tetratricopeptide repeat protein [Bacteroidetes bacterium]|nr:MAG: tetratricopeptide repeat protein [Bacteroidota bacterium]